MPNVSAVHRYAGGARGIANQLKNAADDEALEAAAGDMAPFVPEGAVLVPAPSSSGLNRSMAVLADKIAALVSGATVVEAVERRAPVPSSTLLRKAGRAAVGVEAHVSSMRLAKRVPPRRPVVAVDNVITEGNTIEAMERVIGRPISAVVYADASRRASLGGAPDGPRPVRACVSGSRGFRDLWKVDQVLSTLPAEAIVVHGGASGVDARAEKASRSLGLETEVHAAEWKSYGRAAGPVRNRAMVGACDHLIAFWDGKSRGTASAIRAAAEAGVEHEVILDGP